MASVPILKKKYSTQVVTELVKTLALKNVNQVPRLMKVVVNMGLGVCDKEDLAAHTGELATITGQRPAVTKASKSISNFKLREGMSIGAKVTLRGTRMYEFVDRLFNAALPRIRDFRGISPNAFDGRGNYTLGIKDQTIFPEIDPDAVRGTQGMDITFVTSATDNSQAKELLRLLGMPFAEK